MSSDPRSLDAGQPTDESRRSARRRQGADHGLGIATVYRNLKLLGESGWLCSVDPPSETTRYEVSGKLHHYHFLCRECDRAFEVVERCPGNQRFSAPSGFRVEAHEVLLYSVCATCTN